MQPSQQLQGINPGSTNSSKISKCSNKCPDAVSKMFVMPLTAILKCPMGVLTILGSLKHSYEALILVIIFAHF